MPQAARRAADFVLSRMYDSGLGHAAAPLSRRRGGHPRLPGRLCVPDVRPARSVRGAVRSPPTWNGRATDGEADELFEDTDARRILQHAEATPDLVLRIKDDYDGAEPSGNSVAVLEPAAAGAHDRRADDFANRPNGRWRRFGHGWRRCPRLAADAGRPASFCSGRRGSRARGRKRGAPDTRALMRAHRCASYPTPRCCWWIPRNAPQPWRGIPEIEYMHPVDGRATRVCLRDYACQLPISGRGRVRRVATIEAHPKHQSLRRS